MSQYHSFKVTNLGLTQKPSQNLISLLPLRPLWFVFRYLCVSPITIGQ